MNIAIIDCGTNTFNMLIAELEKGSAQVLYSDKIPVKLGEGGIENKIIAPSAFQRGINALGEFVKTAHSYSVENFYCYGTSAIRNASNGEEFIVKAKEIYNLEIIKIDGDREAELIYKGVSLGIELGKKNSLIMDIGGGSTEFIIANSNEIFWKQSFEIGASRLLEIFSPSDPIKPSQVIEIFNHLKVTLAPLVKSLQEFQVIELIGSSGSFDTLAEVICKRKKLEIDLNKNTQFVFDMEDFKNEYAFLLHSTYSERLNTPGIIPIRAEMIVIASIIVNFVVETFLIQKMRLSTYSLKEGVLNELISKNNL